ncbi:unnamed protein product [Sphagnum balticum]
MLRIVSTINPSRRLFIGYVSTASVTGFTIAALSIVVWVLFVVDSPALRHHNNANSNDTTKNGGENHLNRAAMSGMTTYAYVMSQKDIEDNRRQQRPTDADGKPAPMRNTFATLATNSNSQQQNTRNILHNLNSTQIGERWPIVHNIARVEQQQWRPECRRRHALQHGNVTLFRQGTESTCVGQRRTSVDAHKSSAAYTAKSTIAIA